MRDENGEEVDKTCLLYILNGFNFISILALVASGVSRLTYFGEKDSPSDPFFYILTIYLFPMAALMLIAEMSWHRVLKYFQFLGNMYGKGFFMIFVALLLFDTAFPVDAAVSITLSLIGILNLLATCILPKELV